MELIQLEQENETIAHVDNSKINGMELSEGHKANTDGNREKS